MSDAAEQRDQDDPRGDATVSDVVAAVRLVLASDGLCTNQKRLLSMIDWIVEREDKVPERTVPVRLFLAAIEETKPEPPKLKFGVMPGGSGCV